MVRTRSTTGGGNPAKTGAFNCEAAGDRALCTASRRDRRRIGLDDSAVGGRSAGRRSMAKVFHPDPERLKVRDYAAVAHVPVIFDSNGRYCREHNRYLRERARLEWHPSGGSDIPRGRTLANMADRLLNFVLWCEARHIDWRRADYDDVLDYQAEQLSGEWSVHGGELDAKTANDRADEATSFLRWAWDRGLRGAFVFKSFYRAPSRRLELTPRLVRAGRAKEDLMSRSAPRFTLPTPAEVRDWLQAVRRQRGHTKYLACKLIMETGARRMEVEALDVSQWPEADRIELARSRSQVSVTMRLVVTKGGRPRTIRMPLGFAKEVRDWIDTKRSTHAYRHLKYHKEETSRLFLSDHPTAHGNPVSAQTIYRCFAGVNPHPRGWSPHKGRHAFACFWTLQALSLEAKPHGGLMQMGADWVMSHGEYLLQSLQHQFGHQSEETTEIYLQWLVTACGLAELATGWHQFLEGGSND
jgi:hypothetical protein